MNRQQIQVSISGGSEVRVQSKVMLFTCDKEVSEELLTEELTTDVEETFLETTQDEELVTLSDTMRDVCSAEKEFSLASTWVLPMSFSIWGKREEVVKELSEEKITQT